MKINAPNIQPTFPLPASRLRLWKRAIVARSPVTWGLPVAVATATVAFGGGLLGAVCGAALGAAAVTLVWRARRDLLRDEAIRELVRDSNAVQDRQLRQFASELSQIGYQAYAHIVERIVTSKMRIEAELHRGGAVTKEKEELECLVDRICVGACQEIGHLVQLDRSWADAVVADSDDDWNRWQDRRSQHETRVRTAYVELAQAAMRAELLLTPWRRSRESATMDEAMSGAMLDRCIAQLRNENETTRNVQERVQREFGGERHD
ncbi:MAG: hypothetical protein R3E01_07675 [Pirellulaceae bacterium]|nr:hypothetical protein [Planctomycetales bacterium]